MLFLGKTFAIEGGERKSHWVIKIKMGYPYGTLNIVIKLCLIEICIFDLSLDQRKYISMADVPRLPLSEYCRS